MINLCLILVSTYTEALLVGVADRDITPPIGTPSAGYQKRAGKGMEGIHDPLLAQAMVINSDTKLIALCAVDHLGFTYEMVQQAIQKIQQHPGLENCEVLIGSSHTHSGGGAFLNIPYIGEPLAGKYDPQIREFYIEGVVDAVFHAFADLQPAKIGIGYGYAEELSFYRSSWPPTASPLKDMAVIKVTHLDGSPLAVVFNYAMHPTVADADNMLFSADFVGYARNSIKKYLGQQVAAIFFNGAQGDIEPKKNPDLSWENHCDDIGNSLAKTVYQIWCDTSTEEHIEIEILKEKYSFTPKPTPFGLQLPIERYDTEINLLLFDKLHAFVTIPGELSCIYDARFKKKAKEMGYHHLSFFGLTNDAHGYIITPESWRHKTFESRLSFGGENYGQEIETKINYLLNLRR